MHSKYVYTYLYNTHVFICDELYVHACIYIYCERTHIYILKACVFSELLFLPDEMMTGPRYHVHVSSTHMCGTMCRSARGIAWAATGTWRPRRCACRCAAAPAPRPPASLPATARAAAPGTARGRKRGRHRSAVFSRSAGAMMATCASHYNLCPAPAPTAEEPYIGGQR